MYTDLKHWLDGDLCHVYLISPYWDRPATRLDVERVEPGTLFYFSPYLQYGDFDQSTEVHRSNVRVFEKRFENVPGWKLRNYPGDGKAIMIDLTCTSSEIIATINYLMDFAILDEQDTAAQLIELEQLAWETHIGRDFIRSIERKFDATDSEPDWSALFQLYLQLRESTNTEIFVQGGCVYVNIERLIEAISQAPECAGLDWRD